MSAVQSVRNPQATTTQAPGAPAPDNTKHSGGYGGVIVLGAMAVGGLAFCALESKVKAVPPINGIRQPLQIEPLVAGHGKAGTMVALAAVSAVIGAGMLYGAVSYAGEKPQHGAGDGSAFKAVAIGASGLLGVGALGSAAYFLSKMHG